MYANQLFVIQVHQTQYPLLYRIALDVLPVQASAVPCERVFSSSKETFTVRRTCLSDEHMEQLQILKYLYRQERDGLNFSHGRLVTEEELTLLNDDDESTGLLDVIHDQEMTE